MRSEKTKRSQQGEGEKVTLASLEDELGEYCELTRKSIIDIKRGVNQPSLPVAFRIASFFNVPVEELFTLVLKEDVVMEKLNVVKAHLQGLERQIDELNGVLHEALEEAKETNPDIESNSSYERLNDFYMTLPVADTLENARGWADELISQLEDEKK